MGIRLQQQPVQWHDDHERGEATIPWSSTVNSQKDDGKPVHRCCSNPKKEVKRKERQKNATVKQKEKQSTNNRKREKRNHKKKKITTKLIY